MFDPVTSQWWIYQPVTSVSPYPVMTNMFCNSTNNLNCSTMQHEYDLDRIRFMDVNLHYASTCESSCNSTICCFSSFLFDHTCKNEDLKMRLRFDLACSPEMWHCAQTLDSAPVLDPLSCSMYCNHGDYLDFTSKTWANIVMRSQPQSKLLIRTQPELSVSLGWTGQLGIETLKRQEWEMQVKRRGVKDTIHKTKIRENT